MAQSPNQYRMIVKNRDKQISRSNNTQKQIINNNKYKYKELNNYNPIICKTIQWILCILMSFLLFIMVYYISMTGFKNKYLSQYSQYLPTCSILNDKLSVLEQSKSFKHLLHTQLIPSISIYMKSLKNKINNIDLNSDEWESSLHQKVTILSIIKDKRKEFESIIKEIWLKLMKNGLFAYSVNDLPTKLLSETINNNNNNIINPYNIGFELLFNVHRIEKLKHKDIKLKNNKVINVKQEWNENAFNFYKINGDNLMTVIDDKLLDIDNVDDISGHIFYCYNIDDEQDIDWKEKHLLLINKYPIGNYSGLFVPYFGKYSIQMLTKQTLKIGIYFSNMFESNNFRIGFNSMGAMASVNHLHFQFWDKQSISNQNKLPIEILSDILNKKNISILYMNDDIIINEIIGYPIHGFIYQRNLNQYKKYNSRIYGISKLNIGLDIDIFLNPLYHCIQYLIDNNIPHNLLINRQQIFLFVRRDETPSKYPIFYGFTDVSGWITVLDENVYNTITVKQLWDDMKNQISISDDKWPNVKQYCQSIPAQ